MRKNGRLFHPCIVIMVFLSIIVINCDLEVNRMPEIDAAADDPLSGELAISRSEGDSIHITQIVHPVYNPSGPSGSNNCGPASLAMCLRAAGYFAYRSAATLTPEEQIDHTRALLYPELSGSFTTITRAGIPYTQLNLDGNLTDIESRCGNALSSIGGDIIAFNTREILDKAMDNGLSVILGGYLTDSWKNQFSPYGHWSGSGYHYIAVTGKTSSGSYVVNDPLYRHGAVLLSYSQLLVFDLHRLSGTAVDWFTPAPFALRKTANGRAYVFMRRESDRYIYRTYQYSANGGWSPWSVVNTTPTTGNPVVVEQPSGRLLLFVRGTAGRVLLFSESSSGSMNNMTDLGGETYYPLTAVRNRDGRVEVHARGIDGNLYRRVQTAVNGDFGGWEKIIGGAKTGSGACMNRYGRIEIFAGLGGYSGNIPLGRTYQVSAGGGYRDGWEYLDGHLKYEPVVFRAPDSLLFTAVRSVEENILYYKTEENNWSSWAKVGTNMLEVAGRPAGEGMYFRDSGGTWYLDLTIFVRAKSNVINWTSYRKRNGYSSWSSWNSNIEGIATSDPAVARYSDGRLFVVVRGTTRYLYIRLQSGSFQSWDSWQVLGNDLRF
ncbi:MAG: hypothetical protein JW881_02075 [Spirochaetales bacterium]|nr:hypothetical protein [Spirochaetales bacterium]